MSRNRRHTDSPTAWRRSTTTPDMGAADSIERTKAELVPGRKYQMQFRPDENGVSTYRITNNGGLVRREYTLVKTYPHVALFKDVHGRHECFGYWEVWRRMVWAK